MNPFKRYWAVAIVFLGCSGTVRSCASCNAEEFGGNWVVVQTDQLGRPFRCWALRDVSIANEQGSDGIYWQEPSGNLVHISNHYNRVQVLGNNWDAAYRELGLTAQTCMLIRGSQYDYDAGAYTPAQTTPRTPRGVVFMEEPTMQ